MFLYSSKPNFNWLKQYLDFSRKDRNAILILAILIFLGLAGHIIINNIQTDSHLDLAEVEQAIKTWETIQDQEKNTQSLFNFNPNSITEEELDSLLIPLSVKRNIIRYRLAGGKFKNKKDIRKIFGINDSIFEAIKNHIIISNEDIAQSNQQSFPVKKENSVKTYTGYFDPNSADTSSLKQFGFNNYQAGNLIKYREKGGIFNNPGDLLKIYGIDTIFYASIRTNIRIEKIELKRELNQRSAQSIEINGADSAQLVKLSGIGPVFASRIIKFRDLLGGFYSNNQLLEVYSFPEETYQNIKNNITVDTTLVRKLRLNFVDYNELLRHPYFDKNQVNSIIEFRETNGSFNSVEQLFEIGLLDKEGLNRVKPYLTCR